MKMADFEDRMFIIDALRPIFPQLDARVINQSIDQVRRNVGEVRELIIPGCIDYLLERNIDNNQPRNGYNNNNNVPIVVEDEAPLAFRPDFPLGRSNIIGEIDHEDLDDSELTYVARSRRKTDREIVVVDDDDCIIVPSSSPHRKATKNSNHNTLNYNTSTITAPIASHEVTLDPLTYASNRVKQLFPDIQEKFLKELVGKLITLPRDEIVSNACNQLLEKGYPKIDEKIIIQVPEKQQTQEIDYFKDYAKAYVANSTCIMQCIKLLENEFPRVSVTDITRIARSYHHHYAPARKHLEDKLLEAYNMTASKSTKQNSSKANSPLKLLKRKRNFIHKILRLDPDLQKEIDFIKRHKANQAEEKDRQLALVLNEEQYEAEGQMIVCGCCYVEATFEDMVQCLDGHLFCVSCLKNYAKEAVFGQGKALLSCMTSDCDSTFPMAQLRRSLDSNILSKYEDRLAEESLCLAGMEDLVRCPHCDFAAVMVPEDKVFKCQNNECLKETCRYCKEEWKEHFGLKCSEVEKNDEKNMRLSYEEKMTMAKIRKCHKCGCEFTKSDGCNKMTCRCGTTMCYVCRKPSIGYNHFCQHPKDPGRKCSKCTSCSLWTDPSEDDDMAVKQIEREAKEAKRKLVSPSNDPLTPSKRMRTSNQGVNQAANLVHPVL